MQPVRDFEDDIDPNFAEPTSFVDQGVVPGELYITGGSPDAILTLEWTVPGSIEIPSPPTSVTLGASGEATVNFSIKGLDPTVGNETLTVKVNGTPSSIEVAVIDIDVDVDSDNSGMIDNSGRGGLPRKRNQSVH